MSKQEDDMIDRVMAGQAQFTKEQEELLELVGKQMDLAKVYWSERGLWNDYRDIMRGWLDADVQTDQG